MVAQKHPKPVMNPSSYEASETTQGNQVGLNPSVAMVYPGHEPFVEINLPNLSSAIPKPARPSQPWPL